MTQRMPGELENCQSDWKRLVGCTHISWMVTHSEQQPIISQLQRGRCHQADTGQATVEVIGSKRSYALNWCKPNNDDDDKPYKARK